MNLASWIPAVILAATPSCGAIKNLSGGKLAVGGGDAKSSSSSSSDSGSTPTGDAASVAAAYKQFTFESCRDFDCAARFQKAAGVKDYTAKGGYIKRFNPRANGPNPDPAWLPGWDALPPGDGANDAEVVYEALATAAAMRTWQARCHADYANLHAGLATRDKTAQEQLAKATAEPNPYVRLAAVLSLRPQESLRNLGYEERLAKVVGAGHAIELAIVESFRATKREYAYAVLPGVAAPEQVVSLGRTRGSLEDERESYCAVALAGGAKTTPAPAQWQGTYRKKNSKFVKPPVDAARLATIEKGHDEQAAANATAFGLKADPELQRTEDESGAKKDVLLRYHTKTKVKSTKRAGGKLVVELAGVFEHTVPYDCRNTGQLGPDLKPLYDCKQREIITERELTVAFEDVPETVTIEPGATLDFFGKLVERTEKKLVDTRARLKSRDKDTYAGLHLVR